MNTIRAMAIALGCAALVCIPAGCGPATANISGEVTYDGSPVGDGYITFTPTDGKGKDASSPIKAGRYSVTGVSPGNKTVKIVAVKQVSFASTSEEMKQKAAAAQKSGNNDGLVAPADTIPENAIGNNVAVDIQPGDNPKDFKLKSPARK